MARGEHGSLCGRSGSLLLVGEEFDALVFNAVHGYYRQAIGCLRNALELMTTSAGLAVTNNAALFKKWQEDGQEISFGQGRGVAS